MIWADRRFRLGHGRVVALYVMAYTAGRCWIEMLRIDDVQLSDVFGLRLNVWTSIVLFVAALVYFVVSSRLRPGRESVVYDEGRGPDADGGLSRRRGGLHDHGFEGGHVIGRLGTVVTALAATAALLAGCGSAGPGQAGPVRAQRATPVPIPPGSVKVVATGDIACAPGRAVTAGSCHHRATARLASANHPSYVIALGDNQYDSGRLTDFRGSYDHSWGSLKPVTRPLPGNHEYRTPGARGCSATSAAGLRATTPGTRAAGGSTTSTPTAPPSTAGRRPPGCATTSTRTPRRAPRSPCTTRATPRAREHGSQRSMRRFWGVAYRHHVDVALSGHDHDYERFAPMDGDGNLVDDGILSFVSGTGGKSLYRLGARVPGSEYAQARRFGVLLLWFGTGGLAWKYKTTDGVVRDSGSHSCVT